MKFGASIADVCKGCKMSSFVLDYVTKLESQIETLKESVDTLQSNRPAIVGGELVRDDEHDPSIYVRLDVDDGSTVDIDMTKLRELVPQLADEWPDIVNVEGGGAGDSTFDNDDDVKFKAKES